MAQHPCHSETLFIAELGLLLLVGRLLGEAMQRIGQPAVMGQLIGGLLLGPSLFGAALADLRSTRCFPARRGAEGMIDAISQFGILMLLLLTGMETDLKLVRQIGRAAVTVASPASRCRSSAASRSASSCRTRSVAEPGARLVTALFLGTALSISSVKIVAMVVREMNFMRRDLGQIIVASAIIDDTIGWIIISITFSLASAGTVDLLVGRPQP